jgi:putative ABC transport system permease protein
LTAHQVTNRAREIAIRLALGASSGAIARMVGRVAILPVFSGVLIGCGALLAVAPVLSAFLFEVPARNVPSYGGAALMLMAIAVMAAWLPTRAATRIDPAVTLRAE